MNLMLMTDLLEELNRYKIQVDDLKRENDKLKLLLEECLCGNLSKTDLDDGK